MYWLCQQLLHLEGNRPCWSNFFHQICWISLLSIVYPISIIHVICHLWFYFLLGVFALFKYKNMRPSPSTSKCIVLPLKFIIWYFYSLNKRWLQSGLYSECSDGCEEDRAVVLMPTSQPGDDWWRRWNVDNKLQTMEPHSGVRDRYTAISVLKPWLAKNANMLLFHLKTSITPH